MDYSLLVLKLKFDDNSKKEFENFKQTKAYDYYGKHLYQSSKDPYTVYVFTIIDYFQLFSMAKKAENFFKNNFIHRAHDEYAISSVEPDKYCKRFIKFIEKITNFS